MPLNRQRRRAKAKQAKIAARAASRASQRARVSASSDRRLTMTAPVRIAAADNASPSRPRTFSIVAYTGQAMSLGGFGEPVVVDLESIDISAQQIPVLYDHVDLEEFIVGQTQKIAVENGQLIASGMFTVTAHEPNYGRRVLDRADAGYVWQASVGAAPAVIEEVQAGAVGKANGREYPGPVLIARGAVLREISFVVLGGDRLTKSVVARGRVKGLKVKGSAMSFEEWLLSMGFEDPAAISEVQRANLQVLYQEQYPSTDDAVPAADGTDDTVPAADGMDDTVPAADGEDNLVDDPPTNARGQRPAVRAAALRASRQREAAEVARVNEIRRVCAAANNPTMEHARRQVDIAAHAIASGWSVRETQREVELQQLRSQRGTGPAVIARSHERDATLQAMQGAMLLRAGGRLDHPSFGTPQAHALRVPQWLRAGINDADRNRYMEAAHRYSSLSMVDLAREALRINGRDVPLDRQDMIQAAFSSGSLDNIFTTNVNAQLLMGYMEAPDSTVGWVQENDVVDFKTNERARMQTGSGLDPLPPNGEADHASFADKVESFKISRYAKQWQIDEQHIINDSFGALGETPKRFGEAARRLKPDLVYLILLANENLNATGRALFNSTDGNALTSAALAAATLRTAIKSMTLVQENSVNLNLLPTHIIVPPSLIDLAIELCTSSHLIIAGTAGSVTERGVVNAIARHALQPVTDARLENGVIDPATKTSYAGSATTWYMATTMANTIEVAYLAGTGRAPRVRSVLLDRGKYGINYDVSMDIGAKALDWRGMNRNVA